MSVDSGVWSVAGTTTLDRECCSLGCLRCKYCTYIYIHFSFVIVYVSLLCTVAVVWFMKIKTIDWLTISYLCRPNPEQPRRHNLLNALASIKLRRTQEENSPQPSSTERNREKTDTPIDHFEDKKPQYAVVNKTGRRQSAPEPSYKVYNKPVTSLNTDNNVSMSNNGHDKLYTDPTQNQKLITANSSILKPTDKHSNDKLPRHATIHEEGYNRNAHNLSIPMKVTPVIPPVVKYPREYHDGSYDNIGTTLL